MTARAAGEAWSGGRANGNELDRKGLYACPGLLRLGRKLNLCGGEAASMLTTSAAPDIYAWPLTSWQHEFGLQLHVGSGQYTRKDGGV